MKKLKLLIALSCLGVAPAIAATFLSPYGNSSASGTSVAGGSSAPSATPPGLYVQVLDGAIVMANRGGAQQLSAGQFGYTASVQTPPVMVPTNPGLQFTPPPTFTSTTASSNASTPTKSSSVDCEVR